MWRLGDKAGKRITGLNKSLEISRLRSPDFEGSLEVLCCGGRDNLINAVAPVGRGRNASLISAAQCLGQHYEACALGAAS